MGTELRPYGVACNLACEYCYQNPQRAAGNYRQPYDLPRMKAAVERLGRPFALFGGEPLLLPFDRLQEILRWGFERFGGSSLQTNGALLRDEHIQLFRDCRVAVGLSLDGPGELNDARRNRRPGHTREMTARSEAALDRLLREGLAPGLIVTLHRGNATPARLPQLAGWFRDLDRRGLRSARLHLLETETEAVTATWALSARENVEALLCFARLETELASLRFDVFGEMRSLLLGRDEHASCSWRACDPYTTEAVQGVEGNGQSSNCGRTDKEGVGFLKADHDGYERYLLLPRIPRSEGGCQGCRFFLLCKGQCPGTAIDNDWRNRTAHCEVWFDLFEHLEQTLLREGREPLSLAPDRERLEATFADAWAAGRNPALTTVLANLRRCDPARPSPESALPSLSPLSALPAAA